MTSCPPDLRTPAGPNASLSLAASCQYIYNNSTPTTIPRPPLPPVPCAGDMPSSLFNFPPPARPSHGISPTAVSLLLCVYILPKPPAPAQADVPVLRSCQRPIRTWLVNCLRVHLHWASSCRFGVTHACTVCELLAVAVMVSDRYTASRRAWAT